MAIDKELLDQLLAGRDPKELFSRDGLLDELKKALSERILDAELDERLEKEALESGGNRRNGTSKKTVLTGTSKLTISVPRDRAGSIRRENRGPRIYNYGRRLKTLKGLTPYEFICKCWTNQPDRVWINAIHQMPGLNT